METLAEQAEQSALGLHTIHTVRFSNGMEAQGQVFAQNDEVFPLRLARELRIGDGGWFFTIHQFNNGQSVVALYKHDTTMGPTQLINDEGASLVNEIKKQLGIVR